MTKSVRYRNTDLTEVSDIYFSILSFFVFVLIMNCRLKPTMKEFLVLFMNELTEIILHHNK